MKVLRIIAVAGVIGSMIGLAYLAFFKPIGLPHLKMTVELARTQYQVGEEILLKPSLINQDRRPVVIYAGHPFFYATVYDVENRPVARLPIGGFLSNSQMFRRRRLLLQTAFLTATLTATPR